MQLSITIVPLTYNTNLSNQFNLNKQNATNMIYLQAKNAQTNTKTRYKDNYSSFKLYYYNECTQEIN